MKKVMILSGGTSTAWHISDVLRKYFTDEMKLVICDTNPKYLVSTSVLADEFIQVPPVKEAGYYQEMLKYIGDNGIDVLVPLIDNDIFIFSKENMDLRSLGVKSVAPSCKSFDALSNKDHLIQTLHEMGIRTPQVYKKSEEIDPLKQYIVKDCIGCGSKGISIIDGREAAELLTREGRIVQEVCQNPEITVDAVLDKQNIYSICRERMEIKLGVSTKCRIFFDPEIQSILEILARNIDLPSVFCVQFMKDIDGNWTLIDFNLRSGGGTAISAAVGFQAVRFAAAGWLDQERDISWLKIPLEDRFVVRTYQEVVTQ